MRRNDGVRHHSHRHSRADGNPVGWLEGLYDPDMRLPWIPACTGMTEAAMNCCPVGIWVAETLGIA